MIKMLIIKDVINPDFEKQKKEFHESMGYRNYTNGEITRMQPQQYNTEKVLEVVLTEDEFIKIKRAVLEEF